MYIFGLIHGVFRKKLGLSLKCGTVVLCHSLFYGDFSDLPEISVSQSNLTVVEGDRVNAICSGSGHPLPEVDWPVKGLHSDNTQSVSWPHTPTHKQNIWKELNVCKYLACRSLLLFSALFFSSIFLPSVLLSLSLFRKMYMTTTQFILSV